MRCGVSVLFGGGRRTLSPLPLRNSYATSRRVTTEIRNPSPAKMPQCRRLGPVTVLWLRVRTINKYFVPKTVGGGVRRHSYFTFLHVFQGRCILPWVICVRGREARYSGWIRRTRARWYTETNGSTYKKVSAGSKTSNFILHTTVRRLRVSYSLRKRIDKPS